MITKIQKWGNSMGLRIPKTFMNQMKLQEGTQVDLLLKNDRIEIVPLKKKYNLKDLLKNVTEENLHSEWDSGSIQGEEIW